MAKKYIKGKDGKFRGSIPSAPNLPSPLNSPLPSLPISLVKDTAQTLSVNKANSKEDLAEFYSSSESRTFQVPSNILAGLERGEYLHFTEDCMLFTDSYGESNAAYYPYFGKKEEDKIDLTSDKYNDVRSEVESAESFSQLSDKTKDLFKFGGCAALAYSIQKQSPEASINVIVGVPQDDPSDSTAAHVYVGKGDKIFDAYGVSKLGEYNFSAAADLDEDYFDVLVYETSSESIHRMIDHGVFGNEFTKASQPLIDKVASLILIEQ